MPECACPSCSKVYTVNIDSVGKRARCSECQESFVLKEMPNADDDSWMKVFEGESPATTKENSIKVPTRWRLVRELPPRPAMEMMANWFVYFGRMDLVTGCLVLIGSVVVFFNSTLPIVDCVTCGGKCCSRIRTPPFVRSLREGERGEVLLLLRGIECRLFEISTNIREP